MATDDNSLSIAAFTALGTIVGYLGTEVASASIFDRLLWPSRFYNTRSLKSFIAIILLMPIGGPIHKAAVEALDKIVAAGLWKGSRLGGMLGTAFYNDTKHQYIVRKADGSKGEKKDARNAFWITVLGLVKWQTKIATGVDHASPRDGPPSERPTVEKILAMRPFFVLKLSRTDDTVPQSTSTITGDIGTASLWCFVAVVASEIITLAIGAITAAVWKNYFSIWYLVPVLLKLVALFSRVRRRALEPQEPGQTKTDSTVKSTTSAIAAPAQAEKMLCQVVDFSKGFMLIEGPKELLLQYFRHYGHPSRSQKGIFGDRVWEVLSMLTIVAAILVYPAGLISFIFAPINVQWVWLGYQLFAMLSMHVYRFGEAEHVGTTQQRIARALLEDEYVCFDDGSGNKVYAHLQTTITSRVGEGLEKVEDYVKSGVAGIV